MAIDVTKVATSARTLIADNGRAISIRRFIDNPAPDPSKPWIRGRRTNVDTATTGVFTDFMDMHIDELELVHMNEVKCIIAAQNLTITPSPKDIIVDGTRLWSVVSDGIEIIQPGGTPVAYILTLKR